MSFRYFRSANDAVYEQARSTLDIAWGYPTPDGKTLTAFDAAESAPHDAQGRPYLQVRDEFCTYDAAAMLLSDAMAAGVVEEVSAQAFDAVCGSSV